MLGLSFLLVIGRAVQVQLWQGGGYAAEASRTRTEVRRLEARRGTLYDRRELPLAVTQESYRVGIAPNEVTERSALIRVASRQLGVSAATLQRGFAADKPYLYFYGPYTASDVEPLRAFKGVHFEGEFLRRYPSQRLAGRVIGRMGPDGAAASGLERALEPLITGTPGEEVVLKDRRGRRYESPGRLRRDPVPGNDVVLTIDAELQDIAEQSLAETVKQFEAEGGDIVFLDPRTGEILAVASQKNGQPDLMAFTEPFEPGSTAKIFTAAALLTHARVDSSDRVSGEGGEWDMPLPNGRVRHIKDVHAQQGMLTLAQAIEVSSNIGMAKYSQRLSPGRTVRAAAGVRLRGPGRHRAALGVPRHAASSRPLAARVEPGQRRDGVRVRGHGAAAGQRLRRHRERRHPAHADAGEGGPRPGRHGALPAPAGAGAPGGLAARSRPSCGSSCGWPAGAGGTGSGAQVGNYGVLGKTGTAHRFENGRYVDEYVASMAAIFPADDPQLVVVVKIDAPHSGEIYGGEVAAPVVRTMLEQALASKRTAFDRARLNAGARGRRRTAVREAAAGPAAAVPRRGPVARAAGYRRAARVDGAAGGRHERAGGGVRAAPARVSRVRGGHRRGGPVGSGGRCVGPAGRHRTSLGGVTMLEWNQSAGCPPT